MGSRQTFMMAALLGGSAVAIGAFGAHGLRPFLEASGRMETFQTAVQYQFYHALALLAVGLLQERHPAKMLQWSSRLMTAGVAIFSGSLYLLCLTQTTWLGAITPIGGVSFIGGWAALLLAASRMER